MSNKQNPGLNPGPEKKEKDHHAHTVADLAFPVLARLLAANAKARKEGGK